MAILITGSGLVGSQIARLEVERGELPVILEIAPQPEALADIVAIKEVRLVQGDVLNPLDLARIIQEEKITRVIHTAANPLLTTGAQKNPYAAVRLNIMGTMNVLEAARIFGVERVVLCSSGVLYHFIKGGGDQGPLLKEETYPRPATIYASTKQAAENLGLNYAESFGVEFVAVRFPAVFGPWRGRGGGSPSNLMREMVEKSLRSEEFNLPEGQLEYVYSKDAAQGAVKACHTDGLKSRVFNIGMGKVYSYATIAEMVHRVIPGARVRIGDERHGAGLQPIDLDKPLELGRARTELGYEPQFPMEKGIGDYVKFYQGFA